MKTIWMRSSLNESKHATTFDTESYHNWAVSQNVMYQEMCLKIFGSVMPKSQSYTTKGRTLIQVLSPPNILLLPAHACMHLYWNQPECVHRCVRGYTGVYGLWAPLTNPSLGMTTTKTSRHVFLWQASLSWSGTGITCYEGEKTTKTCKDLIKCTHQQAICTFPNLWPLYL